MCKAFIAKSTELLGGIHNGDLMFRDYADLKTTSRRVDLNFRGVRGSVRMGMGKIVLPSDTELLRKSVSSYSFR